MEADDKSANAPDGRGSLFKTFHKIPLPKGDMGSRPRIPSYAIPIPQLLLCIGSQNAAIIS